MARKRRSDRNHIVYMITNKLTLEKYIGITVMRGQAKLKSLKMRWEGHLYGALVEGRSYTFPEHIRQYATVTDAITDRIRRDMKQVFDIEILEVVRGKALAHQVEVGYINRLQPELNTKKQGV